MTAIKKIIKGGEFLLEDSLYNDIFTAEEYSEEQIMFRTSMRDFLNKEIEPIKEKFDTKEGAKLAPGLLEKMGRLWPIAIIGYLIFSYLASASSRIFSNSSSIA